MTSKEHLDTATKVVYGIGNVGLQGVVSLASFFLLFFIPMSRSSPQPSRPAHCW